MIEHLYNKSTSSNHTLTDRFTVIPNILYPQKTVKRKNKDKEHSSKYYQNIAYILSFLVLVKSGNNLMAIRDSESIILDIDCVNMEFIKCRLDEFKHNADIFAKKYSNNPTVKKKMKGIIKDVIVLTMNERNISPEIIGINLLFEWFIDISHPKIDKDFTFFTNADNYFPILDRLEKSELIDATVIYEITNEIAIRNRS